MATTGWRKVTLGEIYDIGSSKRVLQKQWKESGVPFYRAREIVKLARHGFVDNDLFISEDHFAELEKAKGVPKPGDLMVSAVGTLGACYAVQPGDRFYFKDASVLSFRPIVPVEPRFMQYAFLSDDLLDKVKSGEGATVGTFTIARAKATEFLLPPLDEQKRIVAVLDQAFAALDRARAHAEANLADAEVLRGRGADRLLARYAGSAPQRHLGELAEFRNGLNFSRHSSGETVKVAGVGDFKSNFWLHVDDLKSTAIEGRLSDRDSLRAGDILTVRSNGNKDLIGRVMLVGDTDEAISFSGFVIRIRLLAEGIKPKFLCHYMKSRGAVAHLLAGGGGANISNLNQGILSSLPIVVPPLEDQQDFVDSMNQLNMSINKLVEVATSKVAAIASLRQSLLQKAFSGQLT